ncbi:hypothetical protein [Denitrificimonas caeni]|uniref:hypothetical protein n=1 Tax=Denitrificimonas caeni TaxID=521720 RepID=UPI0019655380|nr:hypothetical protein [Denitrificimonas caeni]
MKKYSVLQTATGLGLALVLSLTALPSIAEVHDHDDLAGAELQLNAGQKWQTDAPLREAMGKIGHSVNTALDDIHNNQLDAAGYQALAEQVHQQVAYMVENCQLEPQADAQLHIVIARLIDSAEVMQKRSDLQDKRKGAVQLVGALDSYATYFNDAEFAKPVH